MIKLTIPAFLAFAMLAASCGSNHSGKEPVESKSADSSSAVQSALQADSGISIVNPTFTNLNPKAKNGIQAIIADYLKLKNALANDNGREAALAGQSMTDAMAALDTSAFAPEQLKIYQSNASDLRENSEHIAKNGANIGHQREHFAMMSEDVYELVKAYGAGQPLYHDFCPMYQDKGAMWISEIKAIKNPYLGQKMPGCGDVKEKFK